MMSSENKTYTITNNLSKDCSKYFSVHLLKQSYATASELVLSELTIDRVSRILFLN